jgi:hypothetical protein
MKGTWKEDGAKLSQHVESEELKVAYKKRKFKT